MHLILGHTFYNDFVCEFVVKFEIFCYILQLYDVVCRHFLFHSVQPDDGYWYRWNM